MSPTASRPARDDIAAIVRESLRAYELGVAENARAERDAVAEQERQQAELAATETSAHADLATTQCAERDAATAARDRLAAIAAAADEVKRAAADLLEKSALGYLRGLTTNAKGGHTFVGTPDEQAAQAFAAAQLAAVDLRQHLLELALTHLAAENWDDAFRILHPLHNDRPEGVLRDTVRIHLRNTVIARVRRDLYKGDNAEQLTSLGDWIKALGDDDGELRRIGLDILFRATRMTLDRGQQSAAVTLLSFAAERGFPVDLTGSAELSFLNWWVPTRKMACIAEFGGHANAVRDVAFRLDEAMAISTDEADLKEWMLPTATHPGYLVRTHSNVAAHALSADGLTAIGAQRIWRGREYESEHLEIQDGLHSCMLSANGESFLWERRERSLLRLAVERKRGQGTPYFDIREKLDERLSRQLGSTIYDPSSPLISIPEIRPVFDVPTPVDATVVYFPEAGVSRLDSGTPMAIFSLEVPTIWLRSSISLNAKRLATLDATGTVVVFDCTTEQSVYRLEIKIKGAVAHLTDGGLRFSGDESVLAAFGTGDGGRYSFFEAWDLTNGARLVSMRPRAALTALAVANRTRLAALGRANGEIDLLDLTAGRILASVRSDAAIRCLRFSHDDGLLASGGDDRTVRLWAP